MKTRLLIVDDSVAFRMFLRKCLMGLDELEVVGVARDGVDALEKVAELKPDVITLDMNMPRMNGMETLTALKRDHPDVKVIIVAAETEDDADRTVQALKAGAFDFILKPKASDGNPAESIRTSLLPRLEELQRSDSNPRIADVAVSERPASQPLPSAPAPEVAAPSAAARLARDVRMDILAIGASTGGPAALHEVLCHLPANLPVPVVVVQHMPALFIRSLASRMDKESLLTCKVADEGERLLPGHVYFAPGDRHMEIEAREEGLFVSLSDAPPLHFCRPAVDAMFNSLTKLAPRIHTLVVVLTGMGKDGSAGALELAKRDGYVIAQNKETSTVWGMPGATVGLGAAHSVLALEQIPSAILATLQLAH
ncbi:MAG TPA: chemotaxis-specific protein-glutamate methyltransferase CheB [Mariprofundaceae bacterium]|nr:chemotaxis-specific protein-glutamate methyltransferase CheB [Mariprofundaceae bacterium]